MCIVMRSGRGFTLLELLVVMAVVSLLVALLLPSLTSARMYAQAVVCQSNQRMVGVGMQMYVEEFRGFFPLSSHTTGNAFHRGNWVVTLQHFGVPAQVRRCPLDPVMRTTSYVTNDYLEPEGGGWTRMDDIPRPWATAFAVEAHPGYMIDHLHAEMSGWSSPNDMLTQIDVTRHQDASNVLYIDGRSDPLRWDWIRQHFSAQRSFLNPATAH